MSALLHGSGQTQRRFRHAASVFALNHGVPTSVVVPHTRLNSDLSVFQGVLLLSVRLSAERCSVVRTFMLDTNDGGLRLQTEDITTGEFTGSKRSCGPRPITALTGAFPTRLLGSCSGSSRTCHRMLAARCWVEPPPCRQDVSCRDPPERKVYPGARAQQRIIISCAVIKPPLPATSQKTTAHRAYFAYLPDFCFQPAEAA